MRKILFSILVLFIITSLSGCSVLGVFGEKKPKGNKGTVEQEFKQTSRTRSDITGEFILPELDIPPANPFRTMKFKVNEQEVSFPSGTTGKVKIGIKDDTTSFSLDRLLTSWKVNSGTTQLIWFGGVLIAVGIGVAYFVGIKLGLVIIAAGICLISCGVFIETYPWVFLIVVFIALLGGIWFIYNQYIKKQHYEWMEEDYLVVEKLVNTIEKLPEETRSFIKDELKKDDNSAILRKVINLVRKK